MSCTRQMGFKGFVVTDYANYQRNDIRPWCRRFAAVSARALEAGIDMDMVSEGLATVGKSLQRKSYSGWK